MRKFMLFTAVLLSIMLLPHSLFAQSKNITGKVTDANGKPLQSVSIIVKQTNTGTTTDADGNFSLSVPANATILIAYTGFKSQTISIHSINTALGKSTRKGT